MNLQDAASALTTIKSLLDRDVPQLKQALGLDWAGARLEVRILLESVLGVDRAWLIAHEDQGIQTESMQEYERMLLRRLSGEPIAYILGQREFYGRLFKVGPEVLIPRPETELLVDLAKARLSGGKVSDVLDLGTGSGCIAITLALERPLSRVLGVDISRSSLSVARANAVTLGARVEWQSGSWYSALSGRRFDLIVSNPPYIMEGDVHLELGDVRFEPRTALSSGPQGLNDFKVIIRESHAHLKPGGWLMLEHGCDQGKAVRELMKERDFQEVKIHKDYAGNDRVTEGKCR
jgi:release factor glutamine methyltransferase